MLAFFVLTFGIVSALIGTVVFMVVRETRWLVRRGAIAMIALGVAAAGVAIVRIATLEPEALPSRRPARASDAGCLPAAGFQQRDRSDCPVAPAARPG